MRGPFLASSAVVTGPVGSGKAGAVSGASSTGLRAIASLRGRYDKILFDSPPVIGVSDASVLLSAVDGAVLLIQYRRNPQSMVLRAQQIVAALKTPLFGVVLNQIPAHAGGDYGYYTHNYAYYSTGADAHRPAASRKESAGSGPGERLVLREPRPGPDER